MTNMNLTLEQIADAILSGNMDFNSYTDKQKAELLSAAKDYIEDLRIDREYLEDVDQVAQHNEKRAAAKAVADTQILKEAKVGDQIIVDTAYTCSPMGEHSEDDDDVVVTSANALVDDDDEVVITNGFRGDPDDGLHDVILVDYPEKQAGKNGNGDFRILQLRDKQLCNEWTMLVGEEDLAKRLQEISYNNRGCLAGMTKKRCFAYLMANTFPVWTVKNQKGKIVTYFDEVAFNKYFKWVQSQKQAKEDAYAEKHSLKVDKDDKEAPWRF